MTEKLFRSFQQSISSERKIKTEGTENLSNPFMSTEMKLKSLSEKKKSQIMSYISSNKKARTSEIADKFGLSYENAHYILKQLEKENKIVIE